MRGLDSMKQIKNIISNKKVSSIILGAIIIILVAVVIVNLFFINKDLNSKKIKNEDVYVYFGDEKFDYKGNITLDHENNITNILFTKSESEIMSLNLKLFYNKDNKSSSINRSSSKNSKNKSKKKTQKDFSFTRNYHNKGMNINIKNSKTAKNNISKQYIFSGIFNKHNHNHNHNSLYTISKNYSRIPGVPFTFNVTKSSTVKSRSKSGSKEKKIINKNKNKNYYSNNNIFDTDAHVYKI